MECLNDRRPSGRLSLYLGVIYSWFGRVLLS